MLHVDPEKRPKAAEARKEAWVNSVPPLSNHKGHSSKYLSSQVSGKSVKTNGSYKSPVARQKRVEEEVTSQPGRLEKDRKVGMSRENVEMGTYLNDGDVPDKRIGGNAQTLRMEKNEGISDGIRRSDLGHHLKAEMLTPNGKDAKPESTVTSYQEEFPSAAATEDSNSFASRADVSPCEPGIGEQEFPIISPRVDAKGIKNTMADSYAVNRFAADPGGPGDWADKRVENLARNNLLEWSMRGMRGKTWQSPRRGELDAMFAPPLENKLKWYMQEKTSVMEKVGMWLEEQNGYSKEERLSNSHGDIDRINKSYAANDLHFDNSLVRYSTISATSSPTKKSNGSSGIDHFRMRQLCLADYIANENTNNLLLGGKSIFKEREEKRRDMKDDLALDMKSMDARADGRANLYPEHGPSLGIQSESSERGEYNGDLLFN